MSTYSSFKQNNLSYLNETITSVYLPKNKAVSPLLFVALKFSPLDNRISTASLKPHREAINEISLLIYLNDI